MNTKNIIIAVVLVAVSFYGGMVYGKSKATTVATRGNFNGLTGVNGGGRNFRGGDGIINGEVISKDTTSITIKQRDGSSKIVLIPGSASIMKSTSGSASDIDIGKQVSGTGTANSDGSVTAQMIQIRSATTTEVR